MLLSKDSKERNELGISMRPEIVINSFTYRGQHESDDLIVAICAAFSERPDACRLNTTDSS